MNKFITLIIFVGLVVLAFFAINHEDTQIKTSSSDQQNNEKKTSIAKPQTDQIDNQQFTDSLPAPSKSAIVTRQASLTPEQAKRQFIRARNHLNADPTVSKAERQRTLNEMAHALLGENAVIPEETAADILQQEKIKAQIQVFKQDVDQIKSDPSLSDGDKSSAISKLFKNFVNPTDD